MAFPPLWLEGPDQIWSGMTAGLRAILPRCVPRVKGFFSQSGSLHTRTAFARGFGSMFVTRPAPSCFDTPASSSRTVTRERLSPGKPISQETPFLLSGGSIVASKSTRRISFCQLNHQEAAFSPAQLPGGSLLARRCNRHENSSLPAQPRVNSPFSKRPLGIMAGPGLAGGFREPPHRSVPRIETSVVREGNDLSPVRVLLQAQEDSEPPFRTTLLVSLLLSVPLCFRSSHFRTTALASILMSILLSL